MSNSPTPEGEDPADLLDRTNLAAYLSARKQLAAENSTLGLPTRPVLPGVLRTDETVRKAMELLSSLRVQAAPLVAMHADNQHYDAQAFISCGDLVLGFLERVNSTATATRDVNVLDRMAALTDIGQAYSKTRTGSPSSTRRAWWSISSRSPTSPCTSAAILTCWTRR